MKPQRWTQWDERKSEKWFWKMSDKRKLKLWGCSQYWHSNTVRPVHRLLLPCFLVIVLDLKIAVASINQWVNRSWSRETQIQFLYHFNYNSMPKWPVGPRVSSVRFKTCSKHTLQDATMTKLSICFTKPKSLFIQCLFLNDCSWCLVSINSTCHSNICSSDIFSMVTTMGRYKQKAASYVTYSVGFPCVLMKQFVNYV